MSEWNVTIEPGRSVPLSDPYGFLHEIKEDDAYESKVVLSPINKRIQVVGYDVEDYGAFATALKDLAALNDFGKVWVKAAAEDEDALKGVGFETEGRIPGYFNGRDAVSMAIFTREDRRQRELLEEESDIQSRALSGDPEEEAKELPAGYSTSIFEKSDAEELAALYDEVFPTYPYPITDPKYLIKTAEKNIIYRLIRNGDGKLVAAASAETNPTLLNSEMTDFAALPSERGKGLAQILLPLLEDDARVRFNIESFYTIARALSFGILRTFHRCGYELKGTLVNNCNIAGKFETMHLLAPK